MKHEDESARILLYVMYWIVIVPVSLFVGIFASTVIGTEPTRHITFWVVYLACLGMFIWLCSIKNKEGESAATHCWNVIKKSFPRHPLTTIIVVTAVIVYAIHPLYGFSLIMVSVVSVLAAVVQEQVALHSAFLKRAKQEGWLLWFDIAIIALLFVFAAIVIYQLGIYEWTIIKEVSGVFWQ